MKKFYENYDELYYAERIEYHPKKHLMKYIRFLLENKKDIKWLDIGCGLGYLIEEALEEDVDAYGIEISDYALRNAVVKERVKFGSITDIPFGNEYFDVVSAFDVIEHIHPKDTFKALSEIHRVLKPGGIFVMTTPNPCSNNINWVYDLTHVNVRPPKYWKLILEEYGFKVRLYYVPSFIKYYLSMKPIFLCKILHKILSLIPESLEFKMEEPLRYLAGWIFSKRGRLYILAMKEE